LLCLAGALFTMTSPWSVIALLAGLLTAAIVTRRGRRAFVIALVAVPFLLAWHAPSALKLRRGEIWTIRNQYEPVKKQYREWYAALGYIDPGQGKFATGVGPGNYQFNVGSYYLRLPAPGLEKMPPDSNNLYLVQAVSIGVLGLGTLLWLFGHFVGIARETVRENRNDWLAAGVLASVAALAFVNLFHATIVRGMGLVMAFVISLAIVASIAPQAHDTEGETL
jgi:hypothetical protein